MTLLFPTFMPDEVIRKEIFWLGHTIKDDHDDVCSNCVDQQTKIQEVKSKDPTIIETHGDIYAPEFESIVKEKKIEGMPWTQSCNIIKKEDGTEEKKCEEWEGYKPHKLEKLVKNKK